MLLNNKVYEVLKYLTQLVLPALATLYFALAEIWGIPNATEVVATLAAVSTFFGVILKISSSSYNKSEARFDGAINVTSEYEGQHEKQIFNLDVNDDPANLINKKEVVFKVNPVKTGP